MNMTGEQRIAAPRQQVWAALNDPKILRASIPGCQSLGKEAADRFTAAVEVKIGPIGARFKGAVSLTDLDPPNGYTLNLQGNGGVTGTVKGSATVRLSEDAGNTLISYDVEAEVGGRMAQLGGPLIDAHRKAACGQVLHSLWRNRRRSSAAGRDSSQRQRGAAQRATCARYQRLERAAQSVDSDDYCRRAARVPHRSRVRRCRFLWDRAVDRFALDRGGGRRFLMGASNGAGRDARRCAAATAARWREKMKPAPFDYVVPTTIDEACAFLSEAGGGATVLAGGQTLMPLLNLRMSQPFVIVDLNKIPELKGICPDQWQHTYRVNDAAMRSDRQSGAGTRPAGAGPGGATHRAPSDAQSRHDWRLDRTG